MKKQRVILNDNDHLMRHVLTLVDY